MGSTWRAVADPTVRFRYNVTPMMTGNLFDLVFDGQSAITGRGAVTTPRHYAGTEALESTDPAEYAGYKSEFLALSPWVTPDASREQLAATGDKLAPAPAIPWRTPTSSRRSSPTWCCDHRSRHLVRGGNMPASTA